MRAARDFLRRLRQIVHQRRAEQPWRDVAARMLECAKSRASGRGIETTPPLLAVAGGRSRCRPAGRAPRLLARPPRPVHDAARLDGALALSALRRNAGRHALERPQLLKRRPRGPTARVSSNYGLLGVASAGVLPVTLLALGLAFRSMSSWSSISQPVVGRLAAPETGFLPTCRAALELASSPCCSGLAVGPATGFGLLPIDAFGPVEL